MRGALAVDPASGDPTNDGFFRRLHRRNAAPTITSAPRRAPIEIPATAPLDSPPSDSGSTVPVSVPVGPGPSFAVSGIAGTTPGERGCVSRYIRSLSCHRI